MTRMIPRKITIAPCLNGYIVQVGCQTVVFDSREKLINTLDAYLKNPEVTESVFVPNAIHREMVAIPQEARIEACGGVLPTAPCPPPDGAQQQDQPTPTTMANLVGRVRGETGHTQERGR